MLRYQDSLTKDDVPAEITFEAELPRCPEHPEEASHAGFGYAGGGYGPYRICNICDKVFGKRSAKDGNDNS